MEMEKIKRLVISETSSSLLETLMEAKTSYLGNFTFLQLKNDLKTKRCADF